VKQIAVLLSAGIETRVRLDPILPGVTDDEVSLNRVFAVLAELGIQDVAISTAFMRPAILQSLRRHIRDRKTAEILLSHYEKGPALLLHGAGTSITVPSEPTRRAIYGRVRQIADHHGVPIHICACKNNDLASGSCHIDRKWNRNSDGPRQIRLF
jgi:DNA repair photolyase